MQLKIPTTAVLWAVIPGAMASLPMTLELLVFQEGRRIGCVNGYGKFVVNTLGCYPFRAQAVAADGDDSDDDDDVGSEENRRLWAAGYGTCSAEAGVLECYEPAGQPSSFRLNGADLELVGAGTGTAFSAQSKPDSSDRTGVDIIIGDGGSEKFLLQVRGISG